MEIKSFAGTGMLLTEKYVLTVAHILPPQMTRHENLVVANTVIAGDHQAKVIKVDHEKELALLQAEDCPEDRCFDHYFAGKIAAATDIGEVTATVGYPHEEKILFKGLVSGKMVYDHHTYTLIDNGINNGFTTLGSSGSPVFVFQDEKPLLGALVIGVYVDGQLKNVRAVLATPIEELREFLAGVKGLEQRLD